MGEQRPHIVIVGGGYVGMTVAMRLQARLAEGEADVTVIDSRSYMTYQPFLAEAAAGSVEPRHVVVPLRVVLPRCHVLRGEVTAIEHSRRTLTVSVGGEAGESRTEALTYDMLVLAPGSVSKTLPIPGLAEHAIGFKTLSEALYLRNHVISRMDAAASTVDPELRRRLLTFVFVGGGYAGIEGLAELQDMASYATRYYESISTGDMRWVLIEAMDRIMPEVSEGLGRYTESELGAAGIEVKLSTTISSMKSGHVVLDSGEEFDADTVVWTAGVAANPMLEGTDLPLDGKGRVSCLATLRVDGRDAAFAAGDCAAVPDLSAKQEGATCGPSAQHAVRQAKRLGDNVLATLRGKRLRRYKHAYAGSVANLGLYRGVAEIYGVKAKGLPAWLLHRAYHLATMPTANRKARILADWALSVPFRRQIVALGEEHEPRREFVRAAEND